MEHVGQQKMEDMLLRESFLDVAELVTPQEQRVREKLYSRLHHVATLKDDDVEVMVLMAMQLARFHASHAERLYNVLQFLLEREVIPAGRVSIVKLMHGIVLAEGREMQDAPLRKKYTPIIIKNILSISYAADEEYGGQVRKFLHQCIAVWIKMGVFHADLMLALLSEEEKWKYNKPRPTYRAAENSPDILDLGFLGLKGKALEKPVDMQALVQQGIMEGQRDGWITTNETGQLTVHCFG
jgi:hypothetical protein